MGDDKNFERQRLKLIMSLSTVAEAMRNCATIAEQFADMVQDGNHPDASHVAAMVQGASEQNGAPPAKAGRKRKAVDEDAEPAKRTRKPKDPNAPKRPASSYILYQNEIRKELREKHPGVTNSELLNIIAKQWAEMSEADKAVYNNAVASAKEQYSQEKKAYDSRSPEEVEAANAANAAAIAAKKATPRTRAPKAAPPVATIKAPKMIATTDSSASEEEDSEEEEAVDDEKVKEKEKKSKDTESDSDEEEDDDESGSEDEEANAKPPSKKAKTTRVVTPVAPAPKEKEKRKRAVKP